MSAKYLYHKFLEYKDFMKNNTTLFSHFNKIYQHEDDKINTDNKDVLNYRPKHNNDINYYNIPCEDQIKSDEKKSLLNVEFGDDIIKKKFFISSVNSHYVMINNNLTKEQMLYLIRNILMSIEDYLKKEKNRDYNKIFFLFFSIFIYNTQNGGDQKEMHEDEKWDHTNINEDKNVEKNDDYKNLSNNENSVYYNTMLRESLWNKKKYIKLNIFKNIILVISIVRYFLHTITISQKYTSSYDSLDDSNMIKSMNSLKLNEINILLNRASEILEKYSLGSVENKKVYINKSNYYNSSKKGKLSVSLRQNKQKKTFHRILAVYFGHERWDLVMNMMIGIRISSIKKFSINDISNYFHHKDVIQLPTSNAQHKVIFKNYAPIIFKNIRNFYGIKSKEYLTSVGPEQVISNMVLGNLSTLSELLSEGKSGSLFYFTSNGKYIIKTVIKKKK